MAVAAPRPIGSFSLACLVAAAFASPTCPTLAEVATRPPLPTPLVHLRDVDDSIVQDLRYATLDNFTGSRVSGYEAGECILTRKTAEALARVQRRLKPQNLSLKVYDCYRPRRAVAAFVTWVERDGPATTSLRFHPRMMREDLISEGLISASSGHSRGNVVDITLVTLPRPPIAKFDPQRVYGDCSGPAAARAPDDGVDMGTGFDCFDVKSRTNAGGLTAEQRRWRSILLAVMKAEGFSNYSKEWWHFSHSPGDAGRSYDIPVVGGR